MYSRNQTNITSAREHRQPVISHPNHRTVGIRTATRRIAPAVGFLAWFKVHHDRNRAALADSTSSLYTTSFPIHSIIRPACFGKAKPEQCLTRGAWVGRIRRFCRGQLKSFLYGASAAAAAAPRLGRRSFRVKSLFLPAAISPFFLVPRLISRRRPIPSPTPTSLCRLPIRPPIHRF